MYDLGKLDRDQGNLEQARHWFREAIATGHAEQAAWASFHLGKMEHEHEHGSLDEARRWYINCVRTGHRVLVPSALGTPLNLGFLEYEHNNPDEARQWWRQAVSAGRDDIMARAMVQLARLEKEAHNLDEARRWYTETIETGYGNLTPTAIAGLGNLESQRGNFRNDARRLWAQAVATRHPEAAPAAMLNLGAGGQTSATTPRLAAGTQRPWAREVIVSAAGYGQACRTGESAREFRRRAPLLDPGCLLWPYPSRRAPRGNFEGCKGATSVAPNASAVLAGTRTPSPWRPRIKIQNQDTSQTASHEDHPVEAAPTST